MDLTTLHLLDRKEIHDENLFITGTVWKIRPDDSIETPAHVAEQMVKKLSLIQGRKLELFEPCAGRGGILKQLLPYQESINIHYNEKNVELRMMLKELFPTFTKSKIEDSLRIDPNAMCSFHMRQKFDAVVMNPPFNKAHEFLRMALQFWTKPGGQIITLFPTLSLSKLYSQYKNFLLMFQCKRVCIETILFDCNYSVPVSLIHIIR